MSMGARLWKRGGGVLFTALVSVLASGCGDSKAAVYPVSGQVLVKGRPAEGAYVVFHPKDGGDDKTPRPYATTDSEGNFKLTTYESEDGAPAGSYKVTIVWRPLPTSQLEAEGTDRIHGKYGNAATSGLVAEVLKEPSNIVKPFQLSQ
ncbi:hypothetical protein BH10PLA2_BH10PLA2_30790 [soil metagenome]